MFDPSQINEMSIGELKVAWELQLVSKSPPIASQTFLAKALKYERQCSLQGDISGRDQKRLQAYLTCDNASVSKAGAPSKQRVKITHGSRLIRNWNGKTYTVSVIENGFVYQDKVWPSLSSIARHITGAHWSGPRFFSTKTERIAA